MKCGFLNAILKHLTLEIANVVVQNGIYTSAEARSHSKMLDQIFFKVPEISIKQFKSTTYVQGNSRRKRESF